MSTGITCIGPSKGLGHQCDSHAQPETRLCGGCTAEAKAAGREIRHYSLTEQIRHAWGTRPRTLREIAKDWEAGA
jgi:hypothetical protein